MSAMSREEILKNMITSKYKSVLAFSKDTGIPESSIRNIFNRGLDTVSAGTLVEICRHLSLDIESLMAGTVSVRPNPQKEEAWEQYVETKKAPPLSEERILDEYDKEYMELSKDFPPEMKKSILTLVRMYVQMKEGK